MRRLTQRSSSVTSVPRTSTLAWTLPLVALATACSGDKASRTDLNPEGPPMVRQVFAIESVMVTETSSRNRVGLAFGEHPDAIFAEDDGVITNAIAGNEQKIRVVFDELLVGNALEEVACNASDGGPDFSRVPAGATPDDVARCAGGADELVDCEDICVGPDGPVGILDANLDGAADQVRMIDYGEGTGELGAYLECDGVLIPLDQNLSYHNPSGNQLVPAGDLESDGLGPALILRPLTGLRTSAACTIKFRPEVTDKDGNPVCAPPGGDVQQDCASADDTSLISFNVQPLTLVGSEPEDGDDEIDISAANPRIGLDFSALLDPATLAGITLVDGNGDPVAFTATLGADDASLIQVDLAAAYAPSTTYVLTVPTTLTDIFGGPLPEEITITFTTAAAI